MENICKICGKKFKDRRRRNGCCPEHAYELSRQSVTQLKNKKGPYYDKWKLGIKRMAKEL